MNVQNEGTECWPSRNKMVDEVYLWVVVAVGALSVLINIILTLEVVLLKRKIKSLSAPDSMFSGMLKDDAMIHIVPVKTVAPRVRRRTRPGEPRQVKPPRQFPMKKCQATQTVSHPNVPVSEKTNQLGGVDSNPSTGDSGMYLQPSLLPDPNTSQYANADPGYDNCTVSSGYDTVAAGGVYENTPEAAVIMDKPQLSTKYETIKTSTPYISIAEPGESMEYDDIEPVRSSNMGDMYLTTAIADIEFPEYANFPVPQESEDV